MLIKDRKNIAIIGSGISGLGAAYLLAPHHNIKLYEKNDYLGGHSRTVEISTPEGIVPVDTGFIVFNYRNYPLISSLFSYLDVPVEKSNMSFGVSIKNGWLEYGTLGLQNIFVQKSNLLNHKFLGMIKDIIKFNRNATNYLECDPSITLEQCLNELNMGEWFKDYYLLAMAGAIWSTPISEMLEFPARTFIRFFDNHGLLTINNQPQWYTIKEGSKEYIKRLTAKFSDSIMLKCSAKKVVRNKNSVIIYDNNGNVSEYDEIIFACHADQALELIENPTNNEIAILGSFHYQTNHMVLHNDTSFMPKRKGAWSSWVYLSEDLKDNKSNVSLSYWMNNLQPLKTATPIIVTLNPSKIPKKESIYDEYWFDHPIFDISALKAQSKIHDIQGKDRFWFCGAYQRYGFHEDGLHSAVIIAEKMGVTPSWI
jgi:uncharacterized protein